MFDTNIPKEIDINLGKTTDKLYLYGDCIKCGIGTEIEVAFHYSGWGETHYKWCKSKKEHLSKQCRRCGYGWIKETQ